MHRLISYKIFADATNTLINNISAFVAGNFFYLTSCNATMILLLRRTLQGSARYSAILLGAFVFLCQITKAQRQDINLNNDWVISVNGTDLWGKKNIPNNLDDYFGYIRVQHGNYHGHAYYRKNFTHKQLKAGKRFFLFFEGVGSYAIVTLNNKPVGSHDGGRTTFTLDVTKAIKTDGTENKLEVKVLHPSNIEDLPWVCGGCSDERGFSEGSQPFGIFRPVHLIVTSDIRIEPFGVHAWTDIKVNSADLNINSTIKNYSAIKRSVTLTHQLMNKEGKVVAQSSVAKTMNQNNSFNIPISNIPISNPILWSTENPYLYKIITTVKENNIVIDKVITDFGFRTINWKTSTNQFFLNGKPVFINGVAEYEHLLGQSHAFSKEQIVARFKWIQAAGFNAFRDGHQPHNLLYGKLCNEKGILWWTQLSAHIWYDTKEFRDNFKQLLKEWVIERRNDPSVVLWGLQNESKLPEDFAKECTELIRSLDPTASSQRLVTTCNGGSGTDWDVPQNWTGTYGGDPNTYANDLKKQVLVGEYGAWRTIDLHTEGGFVQNGILSEDRMTQLMEQKVRLAESAKDSVAGHFFWLLTSHDNPGRVQGGEGLRELDRIGPVNYKGLLTSWEEPTDAFYMYRSNYASKEKEPMVYIVSHTWPNRWMKPGIKDSIYVYSNCDEVELFNDIDNASLGKRKRNGIGTHFQWDNVNVQYNILYAVGYVNGKVVAKDTIVLNHLRESPNFNKLYLNAKNITKPQAGYNYAYRVNCGGPDFTDENGNTWSEDEPVSQNSNTPESVSWGFVFTGVRSEFASQRRTFSPIKGTIDWKLFQTFRYGKNKLYYEIPLPDGEYMVELYFIEPWLGIGGGINAKGMRLFDVAINGKTVLDDLDIWSEAGANTVLKKIVKAKVTNSTMIISFPESKAGQAVISAIAVASLKQEKHDFSVLNTKFKLIGKTNFNSWLDIGDKQFSDADIQFNNLPSNLYGADWVQFSKKEPVKNISFNVYENTDVFIGLDKNALQFPVDLLKDYENTMSEIVTDESGGKTYIVYRKRFSIGSIVQFKIDNSFLVMKQLASNMQPAYDLKPITQYKTNVAILSDGVAKEQFGGRECAVAKSNQQVTIDYPIQTGVADIYSITMKYFFSGEKFIQGKLQLIGSGNTMMREETVYFTFTREGKWNQFTINTANMINAGNYIVRLIIDKAEGLAVSGIDIQ